MALIKEELDYQNLLGVDYSPSAIELATQIASSKASAAKFQFYDLFGTEKLSPVDLILDKGTFDAISLAAYDPNQQSPANLYVEVISKLLVEQGILLITSCNWTLEELVERFSPQFNLHDQIKYPSFTFGGVQGQKVTTIALMKK